jgi:HAD superfamily hydrolase (TIGR01484 family)
MKNIIEFKDKVNFLLTDIDDTLTDEGLLHAHAYEALWELSQKNISVIPVTGRPAGWCEMIARQWPVAGVIGENGGFWFRYAEKKMHRYYTQSADTRSQFQKKLMLIKDEILKNIPGTEVASDQFCRQIDLAIDFCEDVPPLAKTEVKKIVDIFSSHGAQAKVSSIHVNGWFGEHNKLSTSLHFLKNVLNLNDSQILSQCAFVGDSPNDEPMWAHFKNSFAVANISAFSNDLKSKPNWVASSRGGTGFTEIADQLIKNLG